MKSWSGEYKLEGWYVRLMKIGYQEAHINPNGWISGVVYLRPIIGVGGNEGALELSLHGHNLNILDNNYLKRIHQAEQGDIILFPSSLFHWTFPFRENVQRCVIAFDLCPVYGSVGSGAL